MKSSPRDLQLIPNIGMLNKKQRYFNMKNALRKAIHEAIETRKSITIYDTNRGVDVVVVHTKKEVMSIELLVPRRFKTLWGRV